MLKQAEDELAATGGTETGPEEEGRPDASDADFTEDKEHPDRNWYVIHTYSGYENKVKTNLERRVQTMEKEDKIFRVLVPTEEVTEFKDGRKKVVQRKRFPGYVLVEMVMSDDSWYVVRNTPGVTGFVGSGSKPIPLTEDEMRAILRQMGVEEPTVKVTFEIGETVRVISGPFENLDGIVQEVSPERGRLRVQVSMFEREIPVELDFTDVEKY